MSIHSTQPHSLLEQSLRGIASLFSSCSSAERKPRLLERIGVVSKRRTASGNSPNGSGSDSNSREATDHGGDATSSAAEALLEFGLTLAIAVVSSYLLTLLTRRMLKGVLPEDQDPETPASTVYAKLQRILQKRQGDLHPHSIPTKIPLPHLTPRELQMADEILDPDDIESSFADIGGLDATKQEIYELAVLPLVQPELFGTSKLVQPVKGILLYGMPGTGKTMLAKALAKESEAVFLPLQLSKILNKYWGESNKLIASTFSLAHKLQPAVIFIDELDTFLKNTNSETAYMDSIKAEFLTLWDGVATASTSRVLVLGATNKPQHIDSAILRRMPRAFEVPLPNEAGRLAILNLLLRDEHVDDTVAAFLPKLVAATNGYSGSDLKELCRAAAMVPVHERTSEFARRRVMGESSRQQQHRHDGEIAEPLRPLCEADLKEGFKKVRRSGAAAQQYGQRTNREEAKGAPKIDANSLQNLATLLRSLSQLSTRDEGDLDEDDIPNLN